MVLAIRGGSNIDGQQIARFCQQGEARDAGRYSSGRITLFDLVGVLATGLRSRRNGTHITAGNVHHF
jgi:hypothetical protein